MLALIVLAESCHFHKPLYFATAMIGWSSKELNSALKGIPSYVTDIEDELYWDLTQCSFSNEGDLGIDFPIHEVDPNHVYA